MCVNGCTAKEHLQCSATPELGQPGCHCCFTETTRDRFQTYTVMVANVISEADTHALWSACSQVYSNSSCSAIPLCE